MTKINYDQLIYFVDDCLIESTGNKITKREMYDCYVSWAEKKGCGVETITVLGLHLPKHAYYILSKTSTTKRYWLNVKFK